jgi:hypothetical protein
MSTKEAKDAHSLSFLIPQKRPRMPTIEAQNCLKKKKGPRCHFFSPLSPKLAFPFFLGP